MPGGVGPVLRGSKPNEFSGVQDHSSKYLSPRSRVSFEFGLEGIEL